MSVIFESGYSLPGGDLPLKHARIMHTGVAHAFTIDDAGTTAVESSNYTKAGPANELTFERYKANAATWTWEIDLGSAKTVDCFCIAAHKLSGVTLTLQQFTGSWTTVASETISDNSPIMFIFAPLTKQEWRLSATGGAAEIGVVMLGEALQMERPFYQGFSPSRMVRSTQVIGNYSGTGELLGRSKIRTILQAQYTWSNLSYAWVRSNLDGPLGLIQSVETKPCFLAWRPASEEDVDFLMRTTVQAPQLSGPRDLMAFSMSGEVHSYE